MKRDVYLVDVFTDRPFAGNQLAVLPRADELTTQQMALIAREIGFSETAFIGRRLGRDHYELRIFTPGVELPFAGHPTLGAAIVALNTGLVGPDAVELHFREGVGDVRVTVVHGDGRVVARLHSPEDPREGPHPHDPTDLAELLSLEPSDIGSERLAPAAYSCGVPFTFIPVRSIAALGAVRFHESFWRELMADSWAPHVYVVAETDRPTLFRTRMFAPAMEIVEDPATGAAASALTGLLTAQLRSTGQNSWDLIQGVEMGRASRLRVGANGVAGVARSAWVEGETAMFARGELLAEPVAPKHRMAAS